MPTTFLTDALSGTPGTSLFAPGRSPLWTPHPFNPSAQVVFTTDGLHVRNPSTPTAPIGGLCYAADASAIPPTPDYSVEADLTVGSPGPVSSGGGLHLRLDPTGNHWYWLLYYVPLSRWELRKDFGPTPLGFYPATLTPGQVHHPKLSAVGSTIVTTINGLAVIPPVTDTAYTNFVGRAGLSPSVAPNGTPDSGFLWSNFVATAIPRYATKLDQPARVPGGVRLTGRRVCAAPSYDLHRGLSIGFAPGSATLVAAGLSDPVDYTDLTPGGRDVPVYLLRGYDSGTDPQDSRYWPATIGYRPSMAVGFIGDSIMAGYGLPPGHDPATAACAYLSRCGLPRQATAINRAVSGTTTADWLPSGTLLGPAIAAFVAAGVPVVYECLGDNDLSPTRRVPVDTVLANHAAIAAGLKAVGIRYILGQLPYVTAPTWDAAAVASLLEFNRRRHEVCDGFWTTCGSDLVQSLTAADCDVATLDGVHLSDAGVADAAPQIARDILRVIGD